MAPPKLSRIELRTRDPPLPPASRASHPHPHPHPLSPALGATPMGWPMTASLPARFAGMQRCLATRRLYASDLKDFDQFCRKKRTQVARATEAVALEWRTDLESRKIVPASIARKISIAKSFYDYLLDHRLLPSGTNPFRHVKPPRIDQLQGKTPCPTIAEVRELLRVVGSRTPRQVRDRTILLFLFNQGLRVSEVAGIRRNQIHASGDLTLITFVGKGSRVLRTVLAPEVDRSLKRHLRRAPRSEYVFRGRSRNEADRPLSSRAIHQMLKKYVRKAGIEDSRIRPHSGRVFFITEAYRRTRDIELVARAVGHRSLATTRRYLRIQDALTDHPARLIKLAD